MVSGPGEREGVVGPEADWWEGDEDVLAWFEGHGTGKADGYGHDVARRASASACVWVRPRLR